MSNLKFKVAVFLLATIPTSTLALSYQVPLVEADELAMPFTESESGGIGCVIASLAVGSSMVYLMGGWGPIMAALTAPLHPIRVLEGGAAVAFVFSSACYIGVALAPLTMVTYTAVTDSLTNSLPAPPKALFSPNGLGGSVGGSVQGP